MFILLQLTILSRYMIPDMPQNVRPSIKIYATLQSWTNN